ncbi:APC family permease [Catenuloplanes japonicus]|uniref:APC family permease n=1 Tax=Catenuloplanes japonicus TaxID=33876 RepID=UPI00068D478E|nr:amino acid permease [Catenuloplanes japonicus]
MRRLNIRYGTALLLGGVLGPGVLVLPQLGAAVAGPASILAWAALLLLSVPVAVTFAALGMRYPDGGGVAAFTRRAFGDRTAAIVGIWFYAVIPIGTFAGALVGAEQAATALGLGRPAALAGAILLMAAAFATNAAGLRTSGRVQMWLLTLLVTLLATAVLTAATHATPTHFTPFAPHGAGGIAAAIGVLLFAFVGWEAASHLSAEFAPAVDDLPAALDPAPAPAASVPVPAVPVTDVPVPAGGAPAVGDAVSVGGRPAAGASVPVGGGSAAGVPVSVGGGSGLGGAVSAGDLAAVGVVERKEPDARVGTAGVDGQRVLLRSTQGALAIVGVLYLALALATVGVLGPRAADPGALGALLETGIGPAARPILAVAAVLLSFGAINTYLAGASRLGAALARDGVLPHWFARGGEPGAVPTRSLGLLATMTALSAVPIAVLDLDLDFLLRITAACLAAVTVLGAASAVRLLPPGRERRTAIAATLLSTAALTCCGTYLVVPAALAAATLLTVRPRATVPAATPKLPARL